MVLCNSQREEGNILSQICRTQNRAIPQKIYNQGRTDIQFSVSILLDNCKKNKYAELRQRNIFTSVQVAAKLVFIISPLVNSSRSCIYKNVQNKRVAIIADDVRRGLGMLPQQANEQK